VARLNARVEYSITKFMSNANNMTLQSDGTKNVKKNHIVTWIGVDETRNAELLCIERSSVTGDAKANLEDWNKKGKELKTKMAPNALIHACMDSAGVLVKMRKMMQKEDMFTLI